MILVRDLTGSPCEGAIRLAASVIYIVLDDNAELSGSATILTGSAAVAAVPPRTDLPLSHPLRGKRVVKTVACGVSDTGMTTGGVLVTDLAEIGIPAVLPEELPHG
jgi:hypothetical protein